MTSEDTADYAHALGFLMIQAADLERALAEYCVRLDVDAGKDAVETRLTVEAQTGKQLVKELRKRGQDVVADYYDGVASDRNQLIHGNVWFIDSHAGGVDVVKTNYPRSGQRQEPTIETWTIAHIEALADDCARLRIRVDHSMQRPLADGEFYLPESHIHSWSRSLGELPDPRATLPNLDDADIPGWPPEGFEGDELAPFKRARDQK